MIKVVVTTSTFVLPELARVTISEFSFLGYTTTLNTMSDKTLEELEQERMDRLVFGGGQKAVKRFQVQQPANPSPAPQQQTSSPRTWKPLPHSSQPQVQQPAQQPQAPRKWEQKQVLVGTKLEGTMDLSTRVNYLNSLLDQGSITEEEYAQRTEPIRVASDIIKYVPTAVLCCP